MPDRRRPAPRWRTSRRQVPGYGGRDECASGGRRCAFGLCVESVTCDEPGSKWTWTVSVGQAAAKSRDGRGRRIGTGPLAVALESPGWGGACRLSRRGPGARPDRAGGVELFRQGARAPGGLEAKVVDGDLRMWLQGPGEADRDRPRLPGCAVSAVLARGVEVNHNSSMYYLNQMPVARRPGEPEPTTPPNWPRARAGTRTAGMTAGSTRWQRRRSLPERPMSALEHPGPGRRSTGLDLRRSLALDDPTIVWFWGIVVPRPCRIARASMCVRIRSRYARRVSPSTMSSPTASASSRSDVIGVRRSCETAATRSRRAASD